MGDVLSHVCGPHIPFTVEHYLACSQNETCASSLSVQLFLMIIAH